MYSSLRLAQKYIHYYLTAANGKGHGIHSPFVYGFVRDVLNDRRKYPAYGPIEKLRRELLRDKSLIEVNDLGAGSSTGSRDNRHADHPTYHVVADIAKHAAKPPKLAQLLYRIAHYYRPARILELGTSLGISTAYLAAGAQPSAFISIEGAPAIAGAARKNLQTLGLKNADVLTGDFADQLPVALGRLGKVDLAFIDGNHRLAPTLDYFEALIAHASPSAVLIFDDIHWSRGMENAWAAIKTDPRSMLTVDLFFLGLVFVRDEFKVKRDLAIRF